MLNGEHSVTIGDERRRWIGDHAEQIGVGEKGHIGHRAIRVIRRRGEGEVGRSEDRGSAARRYQANHGRQVSDDGNIHRGRRERQARLIGGCRRERVKARRGIRPRQADKPTERPAARVVGYRAQHMGAGEKLDTDDRVREVLPAGEHRNELSGEHHGASLRRRDFYLWGLVGVSARAVALGETGGGGKQGQRGIRAQAGAGI